MKRRLGALLLALSLVLALLPTGAFAVETVIHAEVENDFYAAATLEPAVRIVMEADIALPGGLTFAGDVTLDLNGHVLRLAPGSSGSVLTVGRGKQMPIIDSRPETVHKFTPNDDGLWVLDEESGSETVRGGIITGGTGREVLIWGGHLQRLRRRRVSRARRGAEHGERQHRGLHGHRRRRCVH